MKAPITASQFKALVRKRAFEELEKQTVIGEVSFAGDTIPAGLRLLNVIFLGPVNFSEVRIAGSLDLSGCRFARTLALENARIEGNLILGDAVVEALARPHGNAPRAGNYDWEIFGGALMASGILIEGNLSANYLAVIGHCDLAHCRVAGAIELVGFEIRGVLNLWGAQAKGNMLISAGMRADTVTHGIVGGNLNASNVNVAGNLALSGITVRGDCNLWSAEISGNLFINCVGWVQPQKPDYAAQTRIAGDLHIGASTVRGHVQIQGIIVGGALKLYSSELGPLQVSFLADATVGPYRFTGCKVGALLAQGMRVHGDAFLSNLEVTGTSAGAYAAATLANACIEGKLTFWSSGFIAAGKVTPEFDAPRPEESHSLVTGDIDMTGIIIEGECNLTNVIADGAVLLDDAEVKGDIRFDSPVSIVATRRYEERNRDLYRRITQGLVEGTARLPRASIRRLSLAMAKGHNDVDLTGLELRASLEEVVRHSGYGNIDARSLNVAGDLCLYQALDPERWSNIVQRAGRENIPPPESDVDIPGSADFSGAQIGVLSISGRSFRTPPRRGESVDKAEKERGLLLSGARIGEFRIQPLEEGSGSIFPVPINLADIEVRLWDIDEEGANRFTRYNELLNSDCKTRRSTYIAIERSLRNRGHERDADKIYRAMSRRVARESWRWWQRPTRPELIVVVLLLVAAIFATAYWQWLLSLAIVAIPVLRLTSWMGRRLFWDFLLGFGTAPLRLGVVILLAFGLSVPFVYMDTRNIGPTISAEIANPGGPKQPSQWGLADAIALGLRTHVPIVSWGSRDEWQLADGSDRRLYLAQLPLRWGRPEDFGIIMMILNFLAWPPLLAFALRRAFRHAQ